MYQNAWIGFHALDVVFDVEFKFEIEASRIVTKLEFLVAFRFGSGIKFKIDMQPKIKNVKKHHQK